MIYAVIDTNVLVSALITHNPEAATAKVVRLLLDQAFIPMYDADIIAEYEVALSNEDSFLVTGNLKHYPTSPHVITPAAFISII